MDGASACHEAIHFDTYRPNFILEELAQWLDQFQFHMLGQSADIVMRLDP